jgi:hypothetical protein
MEMMAMVAVGLLALWAAAVLIVYWIATWIVT